MMSARAIPWSKQKDTLFGRGNNEYHKYTGDPNHQPNPCMRPMKTAPFDAIKIHPGDLGTAARLGSNKDVQVIDFDGNPIEGLYACGNDMAGIMSGAYLGPGITLALHWYLGIWRPNIGEASRLR